MTRTIHEENGPGLRVSYSFENNLLSIAVSAHPTKSIILLIQSYKSEFPTDSGLFGKSKIKIADHNNNGVLEAISFDQLQASSLEATTAPMIAFIDIHTQQIWIQCSEIVLGKKFTIKI